MLVINFKNYKTGKEALKLAKLIGKYLPKAIVAVPATDIEEIAKQTKLKVYAQHVDFLEDKKGTGFITAKSIKRDGAAGTLLNHSEHPIPLEALQRTINECRKIGLKTIVCTKSIKDVKKIMKLKPLAIAYEDPKLIATGNSITKYRKKELEDFIKIIKKTNIIPICGAGISSIEDVKAAFKLGCKGVLIASAIADARHPENLLKEIQQDNYRGVTQ